MAKRSVRDRMAIWRRSLSDPLRNAKAAARWIASLPAERRAAAAARGARPGHVVSRQGAARSGRRRPKRCCESTRASSPSSLELTAQYTANYQRSSSVETRLWHAVFDLVKAFTAAYQAALKTRLRRRRGQAVESGAAGRAGSARPLQGARRQVPAVSLRALDTRAMARIPRALRIRAACAAGSASSVGCGAGAFRAPGHDAGAGIRRDAAADAARQRQLHARPGRVGRARARRLGRRR